MGRCHNHGSSATLNNVRGTRQKDLHSLPGSENSVRSSDVSKHESRDSANNPKYPDPSVTNNTTIHYDVLVNLIPEVVERKKLKKKP